MVRIEIKLKELPTACSKCPFYTEVSYHCHDERGNEAVCALGYMDSCDMRDVSFLSKGLKDKIFVGCGLRDNIITDNKNESIR